MVEKLSKFKLLRYSLYFVIPVAVSTSAIALESEVKFKGVFDFNSVLLASSGTRWQNQASANRSHFGFYSAGNIYFDYNLVSNDGVKYGTQLGLEHTFRNNRMTPISLYVENDYGKFEGGSSVSAGKKLRITPSSCGASGMWDMFLRTSSDSSKISYITNFCSFLDSKMRTAGKVEYSRKITYFTPKMPIGENHNIQLGISYIPDSSNMGIGSVSDAALHSPVGASSYKFAIKDALSYGIKGESDISQALSLKISLVGEIGKPVVYERGSAGYYDKKSLVKFKSLNNYVIGSELKYNDFTVMASYSNYNKSLTSKEVDKLGTDSFLYSLGIKYKIDKTETSVTLFQSNNKKNKITACSSGVDYNITKGIKAYASGTYYKTDGKFLGSGDQLKLDKSHGTLLILGMKISF